jgi:hypothetical protein
MSSRKIAAPPPRIEAAQAKPKKLSRERLARLYKSVTRRIPKTLAILAK